MVRLKIISGKQAGSDVEARRFPFQVGRAATSDLFLEEKGVWDDHLQIGFDAVEGFIAHPRTGALTAINGQPVTQPTRLRNGDCVELGAARLQFWLGETRQSGYRLREVLVWVGIAVTTLVQILLIYRLIR
jgi:pSer/pThr/pTyr-binding forkhead associated (FHA) protein